MTPTQIGLAYDQITHLWQRPEFDRRNGLNALATALQFLPTTDQSRRALDIGCGCTGRFMDVLLGQHFEVTGVDISHEMIRLAQQRHPQQQFWQQDILLFEPSNTFDVIIGWDSLWHVPLTEQAGLIAKISRWLSPDGVLLMSFGGTAHADEHRNQSMGPELYYATLGLAGYQQQLLASNLLLRHLEFDQYPELHAFLVAQRLDLPVSP